MKGEKLLRTLQQSRVAIRKDLSRPFIQLSIYNQEKELMLDGLDFKKVEPSAYTQPVSITENIAQELMDELWRAGVRPSGELDSIGHREALESHLNDMRKIVSAELDVDLS